MYGIAILVAISRLTIRLRVQRQLLVDDVFLIFACLALSAAMGIIYRNVKPLYLTQAVIDGLITAEQSWILYGANPAAGIQIYQSFQYSHETMIWLVIFSAKFSFLFFFYRLISRAQHLVTYWRVICLLTLIAFVFCVCCTFIGCPYINLQARKSTRPNFRRRVPGDVLICNLVQCTHGTGIMREVALNSTAIGFDILTDILSSKNPAPITI